MTQEKYKQILETGLSLDQFFILCNIRDGIKLINDTKVQGFLNLLIKKEYIEDDILTQKAIDLIEDYFKESEEIVKDRFDIPAWVQQLHMKCQNKLIELTGNKQVKAIIDKKPYAFLCNAIDMEKALRKTITSYKLKDYEKIESTLLSYIDKCSDADSWFPIMQYFILKNGYSAMVTGMEEKDEELPSASTQKFV